MNNNMHHHPYCTYLTVIIHEDLPFMYIGKGKTKDVLSGRYKGSVSSKQYRDIFNKLKKESPHLIHSVIINQFETNEEAIAEEIKLHAMYDVARCPVFMNKSNQTATGCDFAYGLKGEKNGMFGKKHSDETKKLMKGKNNAMFGKTHSDETKERMSEAKKGENNAMFGKTGEHHPMFGKTGEHHPMFGKTHSDETKERMSEAKKGIPQPNISKAKKGIPQPNISKAKKGIPQPNISKAKKGIPQPNLSKALKGKPKLQKIITCPHCGKSGAANNMHRWHFDNCKNLIKEN
jgi:hypothetical protein